MEADSTLPNERALGKLPDIANRQKTYIVDNRMEPTPAGTYWDEDYQRLVGDGHYWDEVSVRDVLDGHYWDHVLAKDIPCGCFDDGSGCLYPTPPGHVFNTFTRQCEPFEYDTAGLLSMLSNDLPEINLEVSQANSLGGTDTMQASANTETLVKQKRGRDDAADTAQESANTQTLKKKKSGRDEATVSSWEQGVDQKANELLEASLMNNAESRQQGVEIAAENARPQE